MGRIINYLLDKKGVRILSARKQRQLENLNKSVHRRFDTLFDGVVAIAMTIMALELSVPDTSAFDRAAFIFLLKEITVYLISFLALASVWTTHSFPDHCRLRSGTGLKPIFVLCHSSGRRYLLCVD